MEDDNNTNDTYFNGNHPLSGSGLVMESDETSNRIDDFDIKESNSLHASGMFYRKYIKEYMN